MSSSVSTLWSRVNLVGFWLLMTGLLLTLLTTALFLLEDSLRLITVALLVAFVGIPHGGLDHLVGRSLLLPQFGLCWPLVFFSLYLTLMAIILAGWLVLPIFTAIIFFILSAWHFGEEESGSIAVRLLVGGMVIWVPSIARKNEVQTIIDSLTPWTTTLDLAVFQPLGFLLFPSLALWIGLLLWRKEWLTAARLFTFLLVFVCAPVLISFVLYFCFWHSVRELSRLAGYANPSEPWRGLSKVLVLSAPLTLTTLLVSILWLVCIYPLYGLSTSILQWTFIGLSMLAIPHILLHEIADHFGINSLGQWRGSR